MKIAFGCDHAGYDNPPPYYKPELVDFLEEQGHRVLDCGTTGLEPVDYPDFANAVCLQILAGEAERGILLCGTGIGVSMAANRHKKIRAAVCTSVEMARLAREHNNANVLCIGRRVLSLDGCRAIILAWIEEPASTEDRHVRRVKKLG
jgi:ribose 5-phosphate isomerase B